MDKQVLPLKRNELATITTWLVNESGSVHEGQALARYRVGDGDVEKELRAKGPGTMARILVKEGDQAAGGQVLCEIELDARPVLPLASQERATIIKWLVSEGDVVQEGQALASFKLMAQNGSEREVRSRAPGRMASILMKRGGMVQAGKPVCEIDTSVRPVLPIARGERATITAWLVTEASSVRDGQILARFRAAGRSKDQDLKAKTDGLLTRVLVREGGEVKGGSAVCEIGACPHDSLCNDICVACGQTVDSQGREMGMFGDVASPAIRVRSSRAPRPAGVLVAASCGADAFLPAAARRCRPRSRWTESTPSSAGRTRPPRAARCGLTLTLPPAL